MEVSLLPEGIILKGIGGFYYVKTSEGIIECKAKGIFRKQERVPLPGDKVEVILNNEKEKLTGTISNIKDRKNRMIRPAVANTDQAVVVIAVSSPEPDLLLVDKMILSARIKEISVILCINKTDLGLQKFEELVKSYKMSGNRIIGLSTETFEGVEELKSTLKGKITVFAGQSGVGKSTILNRVINRDYMETGLLSTKIDRGKHTTRHAELVELENGGYLVDTPGFSVFELDQMDSLELQRYYPEFDELSDNCRFKGCNHMNEPQCSVSDAVEKGLIDTGRYERYKTLFEMLKKMKIY
jgi:ribosome biogenesis GTPase / thiamine phosphate phosphatase